MTDPIVDPFSYELAATPDFYDWMVFGFLACPNEIVERQEQWKNMLLNGYVATVYGDEGIAIFKEFEDTVARGGKKMDALKKALPDTATMCYAMSSTVHKERRDLLTVELGNLFSVFSDTPGLLGPRIQQVYAAMAMARMEIEWYFRHWGVVPAKSKVKFTPDLDVSFLIFRLDQLSTLVKDNITVVQRYHIEFLSGLDLTTLRKALDAVDKSGWEAGIADILRQTCDDLGRLNPAAVTQGKSYDLTPLRENWQRVLGYLSVMQRPGASATNYKAEMEVYSALATCLIHARNVDQIEEQVAQHSSLKWLYFKREIVASMFEKVVESPGLHPTHTMAMVKALDSYSDNAHIFVPDERANIGKEAVQLAIR